MELDNIATRYTATHESQVKSPTPAPEPLDKGSGQEASMKNSIKPQTKDKASFDEGSSISLNALGVLQNLEHLQSKSNELARDIRTTSKDLGIVTNMVDQMHSSLSSITKNFPPFNVENKERQQILMSYISIRKDLIKMTIPPPPQPIYENVSDLWKTVIDKDGRLVSDAAPALQTDSSDGNVALAEKNLQSTRNTLAGITSTVNDFRPRL